MQLIYSIDDKAWYWQRHSDWATSQLFNTEKEAKIAMKKNQIKWDK